MEKFQLLMQTLSVFKQNNECILIYLQINNNYDANIAKQY